MSKKKKYSKKQIHDKKKKITEELNSFIKEHKDQIITKGREDLGADLSKNKLINLFKANFRERQGKSLNMLDVKQNLKDTLHTETFTGAKEIDWENFLSAIGKEGRDEFRRLRGWKTKADFELAEKVKPPKGSNVRVSYKYNSKNGIIIIQIEYKEDGSYNVSFKKES